MSGQENFDWRTDGYQVHGLYESDRLPVGKAIGVWLLGSLIGWMFVAVIILVLSQSI